MSCFVQEGVPRAIQTLSMAGMKVWMITGDKMETAINIGISCQLISDQESLLIFKAEHFLSKFSSSQFVCIIALLATVTLCSMLRSAKSFTKLWAISLHTLGTYTINFDLLKTICMLKIPCEVSLV